MRILMRSIELFGTKVAPEVRRGLAGKAGVVAAGSPDQDYRALI